MEIRELVVGGADHLAALFAVLPESPTAQLDRLGELGSLLGDVNHGWDLV